MSASQSTDQRKLFFIALLNSQDLKCQVSVSMGRFYWLFHNFCTHGSSLQGWSLHPYSESSVLACAMASISISVHLPPWPEEVAVEELAQAVNVQGA